GDPRQIAQLLAVAVENGPPLRHTLVEDRELPDADRREHVAHAVVVADRLVLVMHHWLPRLGREKPGLGDQLSIVRSEETAARSGDDLVAVEGISRCPRAGARLPAAIFRADRFGRIDEDR